MAGRRPKPTAIKVLEGNPGKRPLNENEPQYREANVRVPYGRLPEESRRLWKTLAEPLAELGVLKETDLPAFEMLCLHYAVARAGLAEMLADGLGEGIAVSTEGMGGIKKHPAASVFRDNSIAFKSYLAEFGLTPSSRVKIRAEPAKELTLAELLFEGVPDE